MPSRVVNVVFGALAGQTLREALQNDGRQEDILTFPDDLSFGPIDPVDGPSRLQWIRNNFHLSPEAWNIFPGELGAFFRETNIKYSKVVCWICRNSICEYCGFCEIAQELTSCSLHLVDTMDFDFSRFEERSSFEGRFAPRLAHIGPIVAAGLIGKEVLVSASSRAEWLGIWQRLRDENAAFRTIGPDGVASVPILHFDALLLACVGSEWRLARRVVAVAAVEANQDNFFRIDIAALTGRLLALIEAGRVQVRGDVSDWASIDVRLP